MMEKVGVKSLEDLYAEVPDEIRFKGDYQLPEQMSEVEVRQLFEEESQVSLRESFGQFILSFEARSLRHIVEEVVNRLRTGSLKHFLQVFLGMRKILKHGDVILCSVPYMLLHP